MNKWNKTAFLSAFFFNACLLQQNLYAGFFDQLSNGLQKTLTAIPSEVTPTESSKTQPQQVNHTIGYVKKASNVRSGPGTTFDKVGRLNSGATLRILKTQDTWLQIEADTSSGLVEGWIYKPLVSSGQATVPANAAAKSETRQNVHYAGYSLAFQPVKKMMTSGDLKGVESFYTERESTVLKKNQTKWQAIEEIGLLRWMERGTLYLDEGNLEKSIQSFANAEDILNVRQQDSHASDLFNSLVAFTAETATGNEEFQEYTGEGYEKVLMLNYKSISYLLDGQRDAYNVARRAIDWQNMEKVLFKEKIEEAKKESEKQKKADKNTAENSDDEWQTKYKALDKIATKVPSAFVNPFGYYVTGMIQEFESKNDTSLRDNARIAYQKALELNPGSKVLKQAVKDMKSNKSSGNKRLLHVVVADGFVPEKKMLVYNYSVGGSGVVPIKLPIYEPVSSKVARIELQTTSGKRLARLSPVADIEAICLRHQKDTEAFRSLRMGLAITRAVGVNQAAGQLGMLGNIFSKTANDMAAPDMRSWMSLPATLQAARLYISKNTKKLKIVSYDVKGRRLANKTININNKSDAFIYARSVDKQMYAHASSSLWTAN